MTQVSDQIDDRSDRITVRIGMIAQDQDLAIATSRTNKIMMIDGMIGPDGIVALAEVPVQINPSRGIRTVISASKGIKGVNAPVGGKNAEDVET